MAVIGTLTMVVSATTKQLEKQMRAAGASVQQLAAKAKQASASVNKIGTPPAAEAQGAATSFSSLAMALGETYIAYRAFSTAVSTAKLGIELAADAEQAQIAFEVMLGSVSQTNAVLHQLQDYANKTPFEMPELRDAARTLIGFGVSAQDVMKVMGQLGNLSAGLNVPIGELAEVYGKARVQGRAFARDIHELTNRGIPIIQELAKQFHVTDDAVMQLVSDGKVGFPQIAKAIEDLTSAGGRFAGMTEKQSQSLKGLWSTLYDNSTQAVKGLMEASIATYRLKDALDIAAGAANTINEFIAERIELVKYGGAPKEFRNMIDAAQDAYKSAKNPNYKPGPTPEEIDKQNAQMKYAAEQEQIQQDRAEASKKMLENMKREADEAVVMALANGDAADALERYRIARDAATDSDRKAMLEQYERKKAADKRIARLKEEAKEDEDMLAQFDEVEKHNNQFDEDRVKQIQDDIKTPVDHLAEQMKELRDLHDSGKLGDQDFVKAMAMAEKNFREQTGQQAQPVGAALKGSSEATSAIYKAMSDTTEIPLEDLIKNQQNMQASWFKRFWDQFQQQKNAGAQPADLK